MENQTMDQFLALNQSISSTQIKGMFTRKNKLKIAIEEYLQNEIDYEIQNYDLKKIRILIVDSLLLRPNKAISSYWYEITDENIWVIVSYPIIIKLDHSLMSLLIKFIISTLNKFINGKANTLQEAELSIFKEYIDDMDRIRSKKGAHLAEKLKQVLFLLVNQYYKSKYPIINPQTIIPPSEKHLQIKVDASFSRIRANFRNVQFDKNLKHIKFRIIPYLFQDLAVNINFGNPLRLKLVHSLLVKNSDNKHLYSIILISTQLLELMEKDSEILDILLTFEIISIENSLKFNRGLMEREIYSIVSKDYDTSESTLHKYYSKEIVSEIKKKMDEIFNTLIFEKNTSILKVYD